jgi:hypothetical protein
MKSFKQLIAEVAEPKSEDELNFKAKHEIEMIDHPESEEHQHTTEKKARKRLADYAKGEDMTVYETKLDPVDHKALKGDFEDREDKDIDNDGKVDDSDRYLHKRRQVISKAMKKNMHESFSVFKPMSPTPGKSVSNRVQVKSFTTSDAMNTFLAKGANALQWKPTEKSGLKSGTYKMDMKRGSDGKPARDFIKESDDLDEDATLDQIRNILTKKNDGTKVIKDKSGYFHIKYKDSSHKGPYHTLKDVLRDLSESAFIAKAAAAKKADKKKFELGDKKFPVTIKKDTADKIMENLRNGVIVEAKMKDSEVLSAAKALAKNGKDAKTKSFGQGLIDYYDENGSFTPAQVGGLQNIMKNASFQLAKEDTEVVEGFKEKISDMIRREKEKSMIKEDTAKYTLWDVNIGNNYKKGKTSDFGYRPYPVLASSKEEAKKVVLDNADAILKDLKLVKKTVGRAGIKIDAKHIGSIEPGEKRKRTSVNPEGSTFFSPKGIMTVKLKDGVILKESTNLTENFKQGSVLLNDGSKVVVSKQNADLLNQMFDELNPKNKKEMMAVAMKDKSGFNEILGFAKEAL